MLSREFRLTAIFFVLAVVADKLLKLLILSGFRFDAECISITYALNDGVAFSMLSFLAEYLKYVQIVFIALMALYLFKEGYFTQFPIEMGVLFGSGVSNLSDRFVHGGVVDYVYWHCGFNFAIFNLADVMIDASLFSLLLRLWIQSRKNIHTT